MNKQLEMIPCPKCPEDFPKLRKELYNYNTCVNCSTTEAVVGITTVEGTGDHTYNGLIIMDQKQARAIADREAEITGKARPTSVEILNFDRDENEVSQSIKEKVTKVLDEDLSNTIVTDDSHPDEDMDVSGMVKGIDY
jgi:hypothetical protein